MRITNERVRGKVQWVLDFGTIRGRRVRRYFATQDAAEKAKRKATRDRSTAGAWWAALPETTKVEAIAVLAEMSHSGVGIRQVWSEYQRRSGPAPSRSMSLKRAVSELIRAKLASNSRPRYVTGLEAYLLRFIAGREELRVEQIGPAEIDAWFASRAEAPTTRKSNLGRLSSLFEFAVRRGYCPENPCSRVDRVKVDARAPIILSPRHVAVMLRWARAKIPHLLPYLVIGVFAGVRPEELSALDWSQVDLERGVVRIDVSKVRRRRIVALSPNACAWLALWSRRSGPVCPRPITLRRARRRLRDRLLGGVWPQDLLRHTAASYMLARDGDAGKVAVQLGNSPVILLRHYRELVSAEHSAAFWGIMPTGSSSVGL